MSSQQAQSAPPAKRAIFAAKGRYYVELHASIVDFLGLDEGQLVEQRIGEDGIMLKLVPTDDYEEGEEKEESKTE